jgi:hypothetical protein
MMIWAFFTTIAYTAVAQPNYTSLSHWAAHPEKEDPADMVPEGTSWTDQQQNARVDVFYIHPTTYWKLSGVKTADIERKKINRRTDYVVMNQASVFNGSCRVFAPRYRQVSIVTFIKKSKNKRRNEALDLAYQDVKKAFQHYLDHDRKGRPFIVAGHSQGSYHAVRLLEEMVDDTPLVQDMVAGYLIGNAAATPSDKYEASFKYIRPADGEIDFGGKIITWNTTRSHKKKLFYFQNDLIPYASGFECNKGKVFPGINPLNWRTDNTFADSTYHTAAVQFARKPHKFNKVSHKVVGGSLENGKIVVNRPNKPYKTLVPTKDLHVLDYNLFYGNIRENVAKRTEAYLMHRTAKTTTPVGSKE